LVGVAFAMVVPSFALTSGRHSRDDTGQLSIADRIGGCMSYRMLVQRGLVVNRDRNACGLQGLAAL